MGPGSIVLCYLTLQNAAVYHSHHSHYLGHHRLTYSCKNRLAWCQVMCTFPLQLFPAAIVIERACGLATRQSSRKWTKNAIRVGLVLICMGISLGGYRSVDNLVSLIGALGMVPLAICFPAYFHYKIAFSNVVQTDLQERDHSLLDSTAGEAPSKAKKGDEVRFTH